MRSAWGRLVVFKHQFSIPNIQAPSTKGGFGMAGSPKTCSHQTPFTSGGGKNWMSSGYGGGSWNHLISKKKQMRIWKKWRSCIIVHNVRWKQKTKITLPPTKLLARPSSQSKIIDLLFCHSHSSLWPLTVTLWPADPCAFFCFGREVCLDVLGQMINPCGFFSSLMAEVRGDCPREVGRFKSEISKYFLGLHKMLEKKK